MGGEVDAVAKVGDVETVVVVAVGDLFVEEAITISVSKAMMLQVKTFSKWYLMDNLKISRCHTGISTTHGKSLFLNTFKVQQCLLLYISITLCKMQVRENYSKFFTPSNL